MRMNSILVATDFSDASQAALEMASTMAKDTGACLLIVHVESPELMFGGGELDGLVQPLENPAAKQLLEQLQPSDPAVACEHHLLIGSAADEIVRFAEQRSTNLIIVGTHGRSGAMRLLLGSVAESIMRHAHCPVLTVKAAPSGSGDA